MKRNPYKIICSDGECRFKYSWNAACREVERMARERAQRLGEVLELSHSASLKDEAGNHYQGRRDWKSASHEFIFAIHRMKAIDSKEASK